jgi:FkbM family methyltransferase
MTTEPYYEINTSSSFPKLATNPSNVSYSSELCNNHSVKRKVKKVLLGPSFLQTVLIISILIFGISNFILFDRVKASLNDYDQQNDPLLLFKNDPKNVQQAQPQHDRILHDDILRSIDDQKLRPYGADQVWEDIIHKGERIMKNNNYKNHLTVVEVGAQNENQSLLAAKSKFNVHCVEPSPNSFKKIHLSILRKLNKMRRNGDNNVGKFIHLYNVAAGSKSGGTLDFYSTGGTGDHVGSFDMWNMKVGQLPDDWPEEKRGEMIKVPSIQLDDIIYDHKVKPNKLKGLGGTEKENKNSFETFDDVYALKVDTQGYEPHVFAGLTKSIQSHKIQYIMTEFWPKGEYHSVLFRSFVLH